MAAIFKFKTLLNQSHNKIEDGKQSHNQYTAAQRQFYNLHS